MLEIPLLISCTSTVDNIDEILDVSSFYSASPISHPYYIEEDKSIGQNWMEGVISNLILSSFPPHIL
jgi:hypothetical protein